ncbi:MAG TPA: hypothetical protein VMV56_00190 [Williamwhitmania sp.]|nr:hypothetical protein [Williamwhitmania sp.]
MNNTLRYIIAIVLSAFGLLTLFLSSSVIFDLFGIRANEGNYVLLVVWANFLCSILYIIAAYGFIRAKKWTTLILGISATALIMAFIGLFIHIYSGGLYETKTIGAMTFRTVLTITFMILSYYSVTKGRTKKI